MAHKETFKLHSKDYMGALTESGMTMAGITAGMIISQKFLDANAIAAQFKITLPEEVVKYQGLVKVLGSVGALHFLKKKKLPNFVKLMIMGVGIQGGIQWAVSLSNGSITQIGDKNLDDEMKKAAEEIKAGMHGTQNPTQQFIPSVAGTQNPTQQFVPSVAGHEEYMSGPGMFGAPNVNLNTATGVGFASMGYSDPGF